MHLHTFFLSLEKLSYSLDIVLFSPHIDDISDNKIKPILFSLRMLQSSTVKLDS